MSAPGSRAFALTALLVCACAGTQHSAVSAGTKPAAAKPPALSAQQRLERGERAFAVSDYAKAEADLRAALSGSTQARAALALARLCRITGRRTEALQFARTARANDPALSEQAAVTAAKTLWDEGRLEEARSEVTPFANDANARAARLLLGEIEIELGHRDRAEPFLMSLITDFNEGRIAEDDGRSLALAARAAWLLRSPKDANTLFDAAEAAHDDDSDLLLWRAQLFLEKYDPAHAEQVLREILDKAPNDPRALTWLAQVRLDQALDFDEAERLARAALAVNPKLARAHFVLAGIALRDMELVPADQRIDEGLRASPGDLELLSLRAVVRFLAGDEAGFQRQKREVLAKNPQYSRLYAILGEYADWEHRYDQIVTLMREALTIDNDDAAALAQLGLNLIRAGNETEGVPALSRAFALDPYNVRVYNTLELFDTLIPKAYVSVRHGNFLIRYHKEDRAILERYVPALLDRAFATMREGYGFTPETPIGIELYAERQSFAVRTSGLPQTAIQGVCFGHTLATMSPQHEAFNLGMTLWHELSHVFHIQLSKSRVPRWFTEGLAEYETLVTRPEWTRHHDPELFELMRADKLPSVSRMSRAFTRAEALSDVATAYYASSKIVEMLAERYGRPKIAQVLRLWGDGRNEEQVFQEALGVSAEQVDHDFKAKLDERFARYRKQFMPLSRTRARELLESKVRTEPRNAALWVELGLARLRAGDGAAARTATERALSLQPKDADARFLAARIASSKDDDKRAAELLRGLVKDGYDGYSVDIALGELSRARGDTASARAAFELATRQDPTQAAPLQALADIAAAENVPEDELAQLEKLAPLTPHEPAVYRRLMRRLLEKQRYADAVRFGEAALWADVNGLETHVLFARALAATGDEKRARFELESAVLCAGEPAALADAHRRLAELLTKAKLQKDAKQHIEAARRLESSDERPH